MPPYNTPDAHRNLQAGIKKMEAAMTPAAKVRREFRLSSRPKPAPNPDPLDRRVVWRKAIEALADFRARMAAAGLDPNDVEGVIVCIEGAAPDRPRTLLVEGAGMKAEEWKALAFEQLGRDDVLALGMIFRQYDRGAKGSGVNAVFPFQFTGLSEQGVAVLRTAATELHTLLGGIKPAS